MKLAALIAILMCQTATGNMLGTARCTYGPSYWCADFAAAKECSATEHCLSNYWTKGKTPVSTLVQPASDSACTFCKDIINDVHNFIADNETREEVLSYLNKACDYMPDEFSISECKKIEQHYLDEFLAVLEAAVDADTICSLVHLCTSSGEKAQVKPAMSLSKAQPVVHVKASSELCDVCKEAEQYIKTAIDNKQTQDEISQMLQAECAKLGGDLAAECQTLVTTMLPILVNFVDENLNSQLCVMLHMCDSEARSQVVAAARSTLLTQLRQSQMKNHITGIASRVSADYCTICEEIFNYIHIIINNNATQGEVKDFLENTVCAQFGELASTCKEAVDEYFPQVWAELLELLDAKTICTDLGLCNATTSVKSVAKPAALAPSAAKPEASVQCVICEFIMEKLEKELLNNATEEEIVAAVEKVCTILPATIEDECKQFIDKYGAMIIQLLENDVSPQLVCTAIGLCATDHQTQVVKLGDENCIVCEMAVSYLKSALSKNATEEELMQLMEKLCAHLSQDLAEQCNAMIEQFAPKIMQIIANDLDGKTLCTELGMCSAVHAKQLPKADGLLHLYNRDRASNV